MIIRFLLLFFLFFLAYTLFASLLRLLSGPGKRPVPREKTPEGEQMVRDPQCGVFLPRNDALSAVVRGERHYFCSERCRKEFGKKG